jgi:hypothetical protein
MLVGSGEEFFFKFKVFFSLLLLFPLCEGASASFQQARIPSAQGFMPRLVKIGTEVQNVKS